MSNPIRDRVLARRDLDGLRAARDITALADALNAECVEAMIPARMNLDTILLRSVHTEVVSQLVQDAAAGLDVSARAQELLTLEGVEVLEPGFDPAWVTPLEVAESVYYPDGRER